MTKQKQIVIQWIVVVMVILLFCTVASQIVYRKLLPVVDTVKPSRNVISTQSIASARIMNVTEQASDSAPTEWTVKEVFVSAGDAVQKGDPIFQIDMLEYTAKLRRMQADIQQQENNINAVDWTGGDRLVLNTKLEATKLEYQRMTSSGTPRNGIITASCAGTISELAVSPGTVLNAYQTYIEYELKTQQKRIVWTMSSAAGSQYIDVNSATIKSADSKSQNTSLPLDVQVTEKEQRSDFSWSYQAALPADLTLESTQNYQAVMVLKKNTYDYVVPRSCVQTDMSGQEFIYIVTEKEGLFDKEYTVSTKNIVVLDEDNLHAAIQSQNDGDSLNGCEIVVSTSRTIDVGSKVAIKVVA